MNNTKKNILCRLLAMAMSLVMLVTVLPVGAMQVFATENQAPTTEDQEPTTETLLDIPETDYSITGYEGSFDGEVHSITVTAEGYTVRYSEDGGEFSEIAPSITNAGEKTVYVQLSREGYNTLTVKTTLKVTRAERTDFAFAVPSPADMDYVEGLIFTNAAVSEQEPQTVSYASSNESVAAVNAHGEISFLKVGTVTITATMPGSANYTESTVSYNITANPVPRTDFGFVTTAPSAVVYGEDNNEYTNEAVNVENDGTVVYSIVSQERDGEAVTDVAEIDSATGKLTILAAGTVVVKAEVSVGDIYGASEATYSLTINRAPQTGFGFAEDTASEIVYDESAAMAADGGESTGEITYAIVSGEDIVELSADGTVKAIGIGSATISATKAADNKYEATTVEYTINVVKAEQTGFAFTSETYEVTYGTRTMNLGVGGGQSSGTVRFSIVEGDDIAVIDEINGVVTFKTQMTGSVTVSAVKASDEHYNSATATAVITISKIDASAQYTISGNNGENGWYTGTIDIIPVEGYLIGTSDDFETEWSEKLIYETEGITDSLTIYLKKTSGADANAISAPITIDALKLDKTDPVDLQISYSTSFLDTILETISFGFYNAPALVTLTAEDEVSGIGHFAYDIGDGDVVIPNEELTFNGSQAMATFTIDNQYRGSVTATAYDLAGRSVSLGDTKVIVVDTLAPGVTVTYDNNDAENTNYYKADRTATIEIVESNFYASDVVITVGKRLNNETEYSEIRCEPEFERKSGRYVAVVEFNENADYTFDITYTDKSGNVYDSYDRDEFVIDKIAPIVSADGVETGEYYNEAQVMNFTVVEHNFDASGIDFTIEAEDALNKAIDLSDENYEEYLRNTANWSRSGDTYTASILLDVEGNYSVGMTYTDLAGVEQVTAVEIPFFCIDMTAPDADSMTVDYSQSVKDVFLEIITLGYYQSPVTVTIEATDSVSGIDHFTYSYNVEEGASSVNNGASNILVAAEDIEYTNNKASATFTIPAQFRGYVTFTAVDKADNENTFVDDEYMVIVDDIAPGVSVEYNVEMQNGSYYNEPVIAEISVEEANFYEADIDFTIGRRDSQDEEYVETIPAPMFVFDEREDVYTATVVFAEDAEYLFDISYTDRSGNVYDSYQQDEFIVDVTAPVIVVTYDNNICQNGDQFNADREAEIVITEHYFNAENVAAVVTANGEAVEEYTSYLSNEENWTHNGEVHTAKIQYTDEAHYTFEIMYTDPADNENTAIIYGGSVAPTSFTLDKSAPTDLAININDVSVLGTNSIAFDTFYAEEIVIKLDANCDISGVQSLQYQKVTAVSEFDVNGAWTDYNENGIVVSPNEKLIIYFKAEDRAGNVSIVNSTGIVVDDKKPEGERNAPEIDIFPEAPNATGFHTDSVDVELKVFDPGYVGNIESPNGYYSGLNKVTYRIYTSDTDAVEEGVLFEKGVVNAGAEYDEDGLARVWSSNITVDAEKFNSNNVIVEVTAVDNAGNSRTNSTIAGDIKIDVTAPTIAVSYSNNNADSESFFKADRIATVVISERNLDTDKISVTITNTDGSVPTVKGWTKHEGTGNGDNTTWTATIAYVQDGDYQFDIKCVDNAGNTCDGASFASGTVAGDAFTIDKTIPVVSVSYDNNSAQNGYYYKAVRTATITITERNFNADRVIITMTATDDGSFVAIPSVRGWSSNGNRHTATIYYGNDARYTFDVSAADKAGNEAADFAEQMFVVDITAPQLEITGVENDSANAGDVIPVITYSDTNYDAETVYITLSGANRKGVALEGSYNDIHNGKTFTFKNFAKEKEIDDIYILTASLTDLAGNTSTQTIVFSVNRFGSTYAMSTSTEALNGSYVQAPVDVVITETNVNELDNIKITLFKNDETITLKEGEDYKLEVEGGNGKWYKYTYTIFKEKFEDDGIYRLTLHSEDAAGNVAENTLDTKATELSFGVDKTKPNIIVTNLENGTTYALDSLTVSMSVNDNLLLGSVMAYLDDYENPYKTWTAEEIIEIVDANGDFTFEVPGDSTGAHKVKIVCVDAAGNEQVEEITDFYVTTNIFVRYYNNKALFFGSIAAVVLLIGVIIFMIKRKKKNVK